MTEKGIDQLRADLAAVDADCAEQIRKTVHDNYHHFIQACQVQRETPSLQSGNSAQPIKTINLTLHVDVAAAHCSSGFFQGYSCTVALLCSRCN